MASRQLQGAWIGPLVGAFLMLPTVEATPQVAGGARSATYGNIRIENYQHSHVNIKTGAGEFNGHGVMIRTLSTKERIQFRLTADKITGKQTQVGKKSYYTADLSGDIHYVITRHTPEGTRTVTGTCGRAAYDERAGQIRLIDGVNAQLTDPATLAGPATVHTSEAVVPASQNADADDVYVISGSPEVNEIALTLREQAANASAAPRRTFAGPVRLTHFRSGELVLGQRARVVGEGAVVEFSDVPNDTRGSLTANALDVTFLRRPRAAAADGSPRYRVYLGHATAEGAVRYRLTRPAKSGAAQSIEGTSGSATYDAQTDQADLTGNVIATLIDPDTLLEPASVDVSSLLVRRLPVNLTVKNARRDYHIEMVGTSEHTRLRFKPKPPPAPVVKPGAATVSAKPTQASPAARMNAGAVEVTGFRSGVWDTGRSLEVTGPEVTLVSVDAEVHTLNRLIGKRMAVEFGEDSTPSRAEASGNVRYHIEQPSELKVAQTIDGTADHVVYTHAKKTQKLELSGPFTMKMTSADGSPSTFSGTSSDRVAYDLTTGALDEEAPDRGGAATVAVRALAKEKSEKTDKTVPPKRP